MFDCCASKQIFFGKNLVFFLNCRFFKNGNFHSHRQMSMVNASLPPQHGNSMTILWNVGLKYLKTIDYLCLMCVCVNNTYYKYFVVKAGDVGEGETVGDGE